jgi:hypothetical protein
MEAGIEEDDNEMEAGMEEENVSLVDLAFSCFLLVAHCCTYLPLMLLALSPLLTMTYEREKYRVTKNSRNGNISVVLFYCKE